VSKEELDKGSESIQNYENEHLSDWMKNSDIGTRGNGQDTHSQGPGYSAATLRHNTSMPGRHSDELLYQARLLTREGGTGPSDSVHKEPSSFSRESSHASSNADSLDQALFEEQVRILQRELHESNANRQGGIVNSNAHPTNTLERAASLVRGASASSLKGSGNFSRGSSEKTMDEFDKKVARMPGPTLLGTDDPSLSRANSSNTIIAETINPEVNHHLQNPPGLPSIQPEALKPPDQDRQSQQRGGAGGPSPGGAANAAGGMPNSHGSVPGGGSRLPPLTSELSNEDRKFQDALSDGVAGVVNSQKGSAEPPPAANIKKGRTVYTAEKASNLKKNVDNMNREFAEGADEVAGASLENSRPAAAGQDKANESPRSDGVLPVKKPVPPSTPPAPLIRALAHRDLRKTTASGTVLIKDQSRNNISVDDSQGSGRRTARVVFQGTTSSPNAASREKSKIKPENKMGTGAAAAQASDSQEKLFQPGKGPHEKNNVINTDEVLIEDEDAEIRNRGPP
jgi:hypothetical protein